MRLVELVLGETLELELGNLLESHELTRFDPGPGVEETRDERVGEVLALDSAGECLHGRTQHQPIGDHHTAHCDRGGRLAAVSGGAHNSVEHRVGTRCDRRELVLVERFADEGILAERSCRSHVGVIEPPTDRTGQQMVHGFGTRHDHSHHALGRPDPEHAAALEHVLENARAVAVDVPLDRGVWRKLDAKRLASAGHRLTSSHLKGIRGAENAVAELLAGVVVHLVLSEDLLALPPVQYGRRPGQKEEDDEDCAQLDLPHALLLRSEEAAIPMDGSVVAVIVVMDGHCVNDGGQVRVEVAGALGDDLAAICVDRHGLIETIQVSVHQPGVEDCSEDQRSDDGEDEPDEAHEVEVLAGVRGKLCLFHDRSPCIVSEAVGLQYTWF